MPTIRWDSKLASVAGAKASKIEKAFGYTTVGDLLRHYPRRYVPKGSLSDLGGLVVDEHVTVIAQVLSVNQRSYPDRRTRQLAYRLEVVVATGDHELMLTFFDKKKHIADWRQKSIAPGMHGVFSGKVGRFRNRWQLTNPQTQLFAEDQEEGGFDRARETWESQPDLITLYPATAAVQPERAPLLHQPRPPGLRHLALLQEVRDDRWGSRPGGVPHQLDLLRAACGATAACFHATVASAAGDRYGIAILARSFEIDDADVKVTISLTSPFCPVAGQIVDEVKTAVEAVEGVDRADVELTFDPPWTPERIAPLVRASLGL